MPCPKDSFSWAAIRNQGCNEATFSETWVSSQNEFSDYECPNIGRPNVVDLQGCKDACLEMQDCTAFNYNAAETEGCILRGCNFPVTAPASDDWDSGFLPQVTINNDHTSQQQW